MPSLRTEGETDDEFRQRAEHAARIAKVLVDASLANECVQAYIADASLPYSVVSVRQSPVVRVEYEQAIAFGAIGETLHATRNKHWGAGPQIMPLQADDWFYAFRITYQYRENSVYNRRFEQRRRMKELLGRRYRFLVEKAKYRRHTQKMFLDDLTADQARAIERILDVDAVTFWRMCRGSAFVVLPPREVQLELPFDDA